MKALTVLGLAMCALAVFAAGFVTCVIFDVSRSLMEHHYSKPDIPEQPPEGYTIITDGEKFKWRHGNFDSIFRCSTYREAVEDAWSHKRYEDAGKREWRPVQ